MVTFYFANTLRKVSSEGQVGAVRLHYVNRPRVRVTVFSNEGYLLALGRPGRRVLSLRTTREASLLQAVHIDLVNIAGCKEGYFGAVGRPGGRLRLQKTFVLERSRSARGALRRHIHHVDLRPGILPVLRDGYLTTIGRPYRRPERAA